MKMDLVCMHGNYAKYLVNHSDTHGVGGNSHACLSEKYWWRSCRTLHVKHREVLPHTFGYIS
jgi:hypothetical protein